MVPTSLGKSTLLATSTAETSMVSSIPTGEKSPYTIIFSGAYVIRLDGDLYGYDTDSSYGTDRRAHVVPVPAMYILSTRMVTSLATENTTFQTIPTDIFFDYFCI